MNKTDVAPPWLPRWLSGKESICQCRSCRFSPWKIPWRRKWQLTLVFLPREFHRQRSLVGYSPRGCKELDTAEWLTHTPLIWKPDLSGILKLKEEETIKKKKNDLSVLSYTLSYSVLCVRHCSEVPCESQMLRDNPLIYSLIPYNTLIIYIYLLFIFVIITLVLFIFYKWGNRSIEKLSIITVLVMVKSGIKTCCSKYFEAPDETRSRRSRSQPGCRASERVS